MWHNKPSSLWNLQHIDEQFGKSLCINVRTMYHLPRILHPISCLELEMEAIWSHLEDSIFFIFLRM